MKRRTILAAVTACCLGVAGVGCGSSDDGGDGDTGGVSSTAKAVVVDVGNGQKINRSGDLKIAFFTYQAVNDFTAQYTKAAQETAKENGVELTTFVAKDPAQQFDQLQSALASKKYNGWVIVPLDSAQECKIATEQAPKAGILVAVMLTPLCSREGESGDGLWAPGTQSYVGGNESIDVFKAMWRKAVEENPGPQKVGIITGDKLNGLTKTFVKAMEAEKPDNWELAGHVVTDWGVVDAQTKGEAFAQANKDLTVLLSSYSVITEGLVKALEKVGTLDKVKIYDSGGSPTMVKLLKEGVIQSTTPHYAAANGAAAVSELIKAHNGEKVEHFVPNDGHELEENRESLSEPWIITKEDEQYYTPDYK